MVCQSGLEGNALRLHCTSTLLYEFLYCSYRPVSFQNPTPFIHRPRYSTYRLLSSFRYRSADCWTSQVKIALTYHSLKKLCQSQIEHHFSTVLHLLHLMILSTFSEMRSWLRLRRESQRMRLPTSSTRKSTTSVRRLVEGLQLSSLTPQTLNSCSASLQSVLTTSSSRWWTFQINTPVWIHCQSGC